MAHARQQIRDAIVAALGTAGLTAYSSRAYSIASLPSVNVTNGPESIEIDTIGTGDQLRLFSIQVDLLIEATTNVDDAADAQAVTLEKAVLTNAALLALVDWIELKDVDSELSGEGDKPILILSHTFDAQYRVNESDPEVIL